MCVVRGLESLASPLGGPITNEFDCPLFLLSRILFTVRATDILQAVSMVHECTRTCQFTTMAVPRMVERELHSATARTEFKHDYAGNMMYCLNLYCIT